MTESTNSSQIKASSDRPRGLSHALAKRLTTFLSLIVVLVISQSAAADNRHQRRGYDSYGYDSYGYNSHNRHSSHNRYSRHSRYNSHRYFEPRRYNAYHYGSRRHNGFRVTYSNHYSSRHSHDAGYFVGGLVLGSLLNNAFNSPPPVARVVYRSQPVVHTRDVVVVKQAPVVTTPVASGRRLLRDLEGNCFERIIDEAGDEIRVQIDANECSF